MRAAICLSLVIMACHTTPSVPTAGPTVTLVDSVVMADPDTFPRALGADITALSSSGEIFLAVEDRVLHFSPTGEFIHAIGTPGDGPGELNRLAGIAVLPGDSILAAVSGSHGRMVLFKISDGSVKAEVIASKQFLGGQNWVFIGDTVLIPTQLGDAIFRRWVVGADTLESWGEPPPSEQNGGTRAYRIGGVLSAASYRDGVVSLTPADSMIFVYDRTGAITNGVVLPTVRRRPVPADLEARISANLKQTPPDFNLVAPYALAIHRLPNGSYVTVHFDGVSEVLDNPIRQVWSEVHYWISIVSSNLSRACVDGEIKSAPLDVIQPLFSGNRMMLLVRSLTDAGEPRTVLREYSISDEECGWIEMPAQ